MSFILGATWLALSIWATDHTALLCLAMATMVGPRTRAQRSSAILMRPDPRTALDA